MAEKYLKLPPICPQDVARFWRKVVILPSGCWEWQGKRNKGGYGNFHVMDKGRERTVMAHRFAYKLFYLVDPEGFCVCHHCDNPPCVNPFQFFIGTMAVNNRDKWEKGHYLSGDQIWQKQKPHLVPRGGTHWSKTRPEKLANMSRGNQHHTRLHPENRLRGENHPDAKLTDDIVLLARQVYAMGGTSYQKLACKYGVAKRVMMCAVKGETWKHVK